MLNMKNETFLKDFLLGNFKIKQIRNCEVCNADISHLRIDARFCCKSCKEKAKRKQKHAVLSCVLCGDIFTQTYVKQKYCPLCNKEKARLAKNKAKNVTVKNNETVMLKSIDGEAIKHDSFIRKSTGEELPRSSYVMLQADGVTPLFADCIKGTSKTIKRLGTKQILDWLSTSEFTYKCEVSDNKTGELKTKTKPYTIIGYYLNYDFENWLVDLPDNDYLALVDGAIIDFQGYKISYIPKKMLHIWKERPLFKDGEPVLDEDGEQKIVKYCQRDIYDHSSYWARSFIKVLDANKDLISNEELAIIEKFKALRNVFTLDNWQEIAAYNELECVLLTRIASKVVSTMQKAFPEAGIEIAIQGRDLYSPKALATKFFKNINWKEKHPFFEWKNEDQKAAFHDTFANEDFDHIHERSNKKDSATEDFYLHIAGLQEYDKTKLSAQGAKTLKFPFSAAFFGGRIESAQVGYWGKIYNYDINSAYPAAMAKLMEWFKDDMTFTNDKEEIENIVSKRMAGMFLIRWYFSEDLAFYPFPYRAKGNVFYPAKGYGWVSCLEFYAWLDSCRFKAGEYEISASLFLDNTEGLGDIKYLTEGFNDTNKAWWKIYNARLEMKRLEFTNVVSGEKLSKNPNYGKVEGDEGFSSDWVQTKEENPAEYGTKIVYNAGYGGTVQQVGVKDWSTPEHWVNKADGNVIFEKPLDGKNYKHVPSTLKVFHDFTAMWITAYCRATIWSAIAPVVLMEKDDKGNYLPCPIVAIQTDGIYSTIPLDVPAPKEKILGYWEAGTLYDFVNLQAGIYSYAKKEGLPMEGKHRQVKQRGWSSAFNFNAAYDSLKHGIDYAISSDSFIARGFAIHQHKALEGCALQWIPIEKEFVCNLSSKRVSPNNIVLDYEWKHNKTGKVVKRKPKDISEYTVIKTKDNFYCPPKNGDALVMSTPFKLKFDDLLTQSDKFKDEIYLSECMAGNENFHALMGE